MTSVYEFNKYITTKDNLRKTIDTYGVAIIPNVLNDQECKDMYDGIWNFLEHITQAWPIPIKRTDNSSWREFYKLYPLHSMLIQHWNVGHSQVNWDLRQKDKIIDIFATIWNCKKDDLLVSFDGLSFNPPPEVTNKGWNRQLVMHTDQSYTKNNFNCIQSWVTALDVNDGDATLAVLEGSNKYHQEFAANYKVTDTSNWYQLSEEQRQFYIKKGCTLKKIMCPKGSMVFWDSRTIHCGVEPVMSRAKENIRAISYLCYMPRSLCSAANLKKKQTAFHQLRTTSHYPCSPKLIAKDPRTYGGQLPTITPISSPVLTPVGLRLAGF